ncbi:hypothetical protein FB451DRAFT_1170557 [Mycena latifolia]|nr:hypothetical protein FB451DRAFT_1170557 [Mycena latifolia]
MATKIKDCEILKTHHHYSSSPISLGFAERYLADVAVIDQLINVKQTSALEALMSLWSDLWLYTVGLASPRHCKIVEKHFPSRREQPTFGCKTLNFQPGKKGWQQLPDEIRTRVFKHFDIQDITAMAETHPYYCSYFVDIMRDFFESSFEQWGLNWMTVKVMLYDTDALISGPTANALMHPYRSVATEYMPSATMKHPHHMISKTIVLKHKNSVKYPAEIQIHVSSRENPRASVIRQQLTGLFACAQGFPIHYPDLTLNVCGDNLTCPSLVRSTWKDSLFLLPFYELLWVNNHGLKKPRDMQQESLWIARYECNTSVWDVKP